MRLTEDQIRAELELLESEFELLKWEVLDLKRDNTNLKKRLKRAYDKIECLQKK